MLKFHTDTKQERKSIKTSWATSCVNSAQEPNFSETFCLRHHGNDVVGDRGRLFLCVRTCKQPPPDEGDRERL
jgi:hypothetical protein